MALEAVYNAGGVWWVSSGTLAERPAAGVYGRLYLITDPNSLAWTYDTGASWISIGASEAAASILAKLLTVDADDSGLNANFLQGKVADEFLLKAGDTMTGALVLAASSFGTAAGTIAQGDDNRLSNTRTPTDASVTPAKMSADNKGVIICTSTTRPASPVKGQLIYETDTDQILKNTGTPTTPVWVNTASASAVASESASGTVKGNAPAATPADPTVYFRSDPIWETYITGLSVTYNGPASIIIGSGAAYVQSVNRIVNVPANVTLSGLTLTANTWYYVYLISDGTFEITTTAPVIYKGAARNNGTTSRRFLSSIRSSGTANTLFNFHSFGDRTYWLENTSPAPFRVASGVGGTAVNTIDTSAVVPPPSRAAAIRLIHAGTTGVMQISNPNTSGIFAALVAGQSYVTDVSLNAARAFTIQFSGSPGGSGGLADVYGFVEER